MSERQGTTSVRVRDYPDKDSANPEPVSQAAAIGINGFLSQKALKEITKTSNLLAITTLEMCVDTRLTSIGSLGGMVPCLETLKFIDSYIPTIRDLGTGFGSLKHFSLSRCGLEDLDGICCFTSLQELYLPYNDVNDISPISMLEALEVLDLEGNNIEELSQIEFLAFCPKLSTLVLDGNPLKSRPSPDSSEEECEAYRYRKAVATAIPTLRWLDDKVILCEIVDGQRVLMESQDAWNTGIGQQREGMIVMDSIKYADQEVLEEEVSEEDLPTPPSGESVAKFGDPISIGWSTRPQSRSGRSSIAAKIARPSSAAAFRRPKTAGSGGRPSSAAMIGRPRTAARSGRSSAFADEFCSAYNDRPWTGSHSSSSRSGDSPALSDYAGSSLYSSNENLEEDGSSELTHGSKEVFCGNPVRALLARRKDLTSTATGRANPGQSTSGGSSTGTSTRSTNKRHETFVPERTYYLKEEENLNDKDVLEELKEWRLKFAQRLSEDTTSTASPTTEDKSVDDNGRCVISPVPPPTRPKNPFKLSPGGTPALLNGDVGDRPRTTASFRSRRYKASGSDSWSPDNSTSPTSPSPPTSTPPLKPSLVSPNLRSKRRSHSPQTNRSSASTECRPISHVSRVTLPDDAHMEYRPNTAMAAMQRTRVDKSL